MLQKNKEFSDKYFPILEKTFGFKNKVKILPVNFNQKWYHIILDQKFSFAFSLFSEMLIRSFLALLPIAVGLVFASQNYNLFYLVAFFYFAVFLISAISMYNYCIFVANTMESVMFSAVKFFLVVDPVFHSTRSSGQIIAKVNRGSEAYESFLDILTFDIVGAVVAIFSVVITMVTINFRSGIWALVFVVLIAAISTINQVNMVKVTAPQWMGDEDKLKAANVETLQQVSHIRSSFASNEQLSKLSRLVSRLQLTLATSWFSGIFSTITIRVAFAISFLVIGSQVITAIQIGELSSALGISLLASYLSSSGQVVNFGRVVEKFTDRMSRITDLYEFIENFGEQTYPVLVEKEKMN